MQEQAGVPNSARQAHRQEQPSTAKVIEEAGSVEALQAEEMTHGLAAPSSSSFPKPANALSSGALQGLIIS